MVAFGITTALMVSVQMFALVVSIMVLPRVQAHR